MSVNCRSPRELRIEELADQVRALSADNGRLIKKSNNFRQQIFQLLAFVARQSHERTHLMVVRENIELRVENERLKAENKSLRNSELSMSILKDAQRYWWLQKGCHLEYITDEREAGRAEGPDGMTRAIDEAMKDD